MTKKRKLSEAELTECAKLKEIFDNKKKELGLTQTILADKFKMTQPAIGHYLNGTNALHLQIAAQFAEILKVSIFEFSPRLAAELEWLTQNQPEKGDNFTLTHRQSTQNVPLLGQVEAGAFTEAVQFDEISTWRVSNKKCSSKAFALNVSGYSMYNPISRESFEPGDIILVDPELPYHNGSLVIAITDEGTATFKKLFIEDGQYYLKALNPDWKPSIQTITKPTQICGVVYEKQVDF